ncbi:MAG: nicotinate-nucleotide--dimethylbenzimidazole phosphoribosyltransferase [Candidatus Accumulibacter sp.]|jgi:nicotinate-nucleotide--dimethylbenzimidazole phosphoribosyltransferase|nr:nicotinate-nucleotide--dimethylbenzimidazole phosphoribosyltransferase [Accumulibacter sp.]
MPYTIPVIPPLARELEPALRAAINDKTKPPGSLGRLEEIALRLGLMQGTLAPALDAPVVLVFAGDHGLADEGVSPFPKAVTVQMVNNFLAGGAAINVFARRNGLALKVIDAGVAGPLAAHPDLIARKVLPGTRNALFEPAMTPAEVELCFEHAGRLIADLDARGCKAVLFGEMGIGNTSIASLLMSALTGEPLETCTGRGAGHDAAGLSRKLEILRRVQARHGPIADPLAALAAYGGCEVAMMAGAMLSCASRRMLVMNDGFIVTSALLVASRLDPAVLDYAVFGHVSAEGAHPKLVSLLGGRPLLSLDLRLGEGTGAALAWPIVVSAADFLREMATFESARVSKR